MRDGAAAFSLGPWAARLFLAVQRCAVPRSRTFTEDQVRASLAIVDTLLEDQPAALKRQLLAFVVLIEALAFLAGAGRFRELGRARQDQVLDWLFAAPVPLLRKGFWGLNTLVKASVFCQPSVHPSIRYHLKAASHG